MKRGRYLAYRIERPRRAAITLPHDPVFIESRQQLPGAARGGLRPGIQARLDSCRLRRALEKRFKLRNIGLHGVRMDLYGIARSQQDCSGEYSRRFELAAQRIESDAQAQPPGFGG